MDKGAEALKDYQLEVFTPTCPETQEAEPRAAFADD